MPRNVVTPEEIEVEALRLPCFVTDLTGKEE
jgi:hypothetical protein